MSTFVNGLVLPFGIWFLTKCIASLSVGALGTHKAHLSPVLAP